jgi:hypothetical protein
MGDANLTQPVPTPLPTPERKKVYDKLVDDHHSGVRRFKSVAAFHQAYLEQSGTPRKKSVGKDRLFGGMKVGRKLNRRSKKQRAAANAADLAGKARRCDQNRSTLVPSESKNNRHGMRGQASQAADRLLLNRSDAKADGAAH